MHTIRTRYLQHSIYTYSGIVLIAVNPFQKVSLYSQDIIQAYAGRRRGELEPHLFAIAEDAYRCMLRDAKNQTIVVSGESGAGKTVSAKYIMRYFATVEDPERPNRKQISRSNNSGMSEVEEQILATNPIMEAFGNAKTTRNDNSSRFGKYIEILFDSGTSIVGARMRTYLLERSRLIYQPDVERNYHIFYQLCAGAPATERRNLELGDATTYHYLNQGGNVHIDNVDDAADFEITQRALSTVGITIGVQWQVFRLLAALLHLGNIKITATRSDASVAEDDPALISATKLLGINSAEFRKWIVKRQIITRNEKIVSNLNAQQAAVIRDSVAKYIYSSLFDWLVSVVNESLSNDEINERVASFIGVLDIYGFEHFQKNSFEQFCINYANEKLQQEFNQHVFKLEQEEYVREKIEWKFIDFADNQPCIDMIEGKLGILALLDEESRLPSGGDQSWLQKLYQNFDKPQHKDTFKKPRFGQTAFTVVHYALDVTYECEGFIEKNKDSVPDEQIALLEDTTLDFLRTMLDTAANVNAPKAESKNKRMSVMVKKPTLGSIFKSSLISLMDTINSTNVHYIRCIKPNEAKVAWEFEPPMVLGQLRACGVLETIRISCAGYPSRWTFDEFVQRYYMLVRSPDWNHDTKELCSLILQATIHEADKYQVGLTKIFFRAGMLAYLEKLRADRLNECVTLIQKNMLRHMHQKRYVDLRRSTVLLQSAWRVKVARMQLQRLRNERAAIVLQKNVRSLLMQKQFQRARASVITIQSFTRGILQRAKFANMREHLAATRIQTAWRGHVQRASYVSDRKKVILVQSIHRRRLARRELLQLKTEARSVIHFKEVSYQLENKVVELTQNLATRTKENRSLHDRLNALEAQMRSWIDKYEKADARSRELESKPTIPMAEFEALTAAKKDLDNKHFEVTKDNKAKSAEIARLTQELKTAQDHLQEEKAKPTAQTAVAANGTAIKLDGDPAQVYALKQEIASLKEQLLRTRTEKPVSESRDAEAGGYLGRDQSGGGKQLPKRTRPRRHSSAEVLPELEYSSVEGGANDLGARRGGQAPRPVSVSYSQNQVSKLRSPGGGMLGDIQDDPEEEIIKILEDEDTLDDEVLTGIIKTLKIPMPSSQNPPSRKEILFPSHLMSLITSEMWKVEFTRESERFLANVMQTIQHQVMGYQGDDVVMPGTFWLSNVHELLSFVCTAEADMLQDMPLENGNLAEWHDYERLVSIVKHDLESLEYNIYHTWMKEVKKRLHKMVIPAIIESQSLPGFITTDSNRFFNKLLASGANPAFSMDDMLNLLNKVWKAMKSYYVEQAVVQQVVTELLKLVGVTAFNDLLMRRNFCSWKRGMLLYSANLTNPLQPCRFNTTSLVSKSGARVTTCPKGHCNWSI